MRKIESAAERERKRKKNIRMMSIFMLIVLVLGTVGYAFSSFGGSGKEKSINGVGIKEGVDGQTIVTIDGVDLVLLNSIESTENVSVSMTKNLDSYKGKILYIDSNNSAVINEVYQVLGKFASRIQKACYGACEEDLPEKNCSENLIIWKDSAENRVYSDENCIFIDGDLTSTDAFLYKVLGIN